jgi:hypothetical protein
MANLRKTKSILILLTVVALFLFSACQASSNNIRPTPPQTTMQSVAFTPQAGSPVPLSHDVLEDCAQYTARKIEEFQKIESGMSFREICKIVGKPNRDICSGIYCYSYLLDDGSKVLISFTNFDEPAKVQFP